MSEDRIKKTFMNGNINWSKEERKAKKEMATRRRGGFEKIKCEEMEEEIEKHVTIHIVNEGNIPTGLYRQVK